MSWHVQDLLREAPAARSLTARQRLVLEELARAGQGDTGTECRPGQARIAEHVGLQQRQVRNILGQLEDLGWIRKDRRATQHYPAWYSVALGEPGVFHRSPERQSRAAILDPERQSGAPRAAMWLPPKDERPIERKRAREKTDKPIQNQFLMAVPDTEDDSPPVNDQERLKEFRKAMGV